MALVQYTAIVNQIRGKLNGSVFNKSRNGYTLQRKQMPKQGSSSAQTQRRSSFSRVQRTWRTLTPDQQVNYQIAANNNPTTDRFGQPTVLAGYNQFVKVNLIRVMLGLPILLDVSTEAAAPFDFEIVDYTLLWQPVGTGPRTIRADVVFELLTTMLDDVNVIVYYSLPVNGGVTSYSGQWFEMGSEPFLAPENIGTELEIDVNRVVSNAYPVPVAGQAAFIRLDVWNLTVGALVSSQMQLMPFVFV